jgi:hypothetical protein
MRIVNRLSCLGAMSAVVGALIATAPAWYKNPDSNRSQSIATAVAEAKPASRVPASVPPGRLGAGRFMERHSLLASVAGTTSWEELVAETQSWIARTPSSKRAFALEALLTQAFEEHPDRVLSYVLGLDIDSYLLSRIFRSWAEVDADRMLAFLVQIDAPRIERQLALAVLVASGDSPETLARLVDASDSLDLVSLESSYASWLAESGDTSGAFEKALSLATYDEKRLALERIARASGDSAALFSLSTAVNDVRLRKAFLSELHKQWSRNDVLGFFEHLKSIDPRDPVVNPTVINGLLFAAEFAPVRTLALAAELGEPLQTRARSVSLEAIAAQDPQAALQHLNSITNRSQRSELLDELATGYARNDLEGALAWLSTLEESDADLAASPILSAIAATDLERAIDLRLSGLNRTSVTWLSIPMRSDMDDPAYLAQKVFNSGDNALLNAVLSRWATSESSDAVAWIRNKETLPSQVISSVAQDVLRYNSIDEAFNYARLLSADQRSTWVQAAAFAGAGYDAQGTLSALRQFQQEAFYEQAVSAVLASTASVHGPHRAAELAGSAPSSQSAMVIGHRWADEAPREAAAWALNLSDPVVRADTATAVAEVWIRDDPESASRWLNDVTDNGLRDRILRRVCPRNPEVSACG